MKISVIINTFNEEKNIKNCLESVKWADEIVLVDMYSEDKTVEIARKYTNKIFFHERVGYADPARQFALEETSNKWILAVDADELVTYKLKCKIDEIASNDSADVVYVPRKNYFSGRKINGMGWGALDDSQPRFFKRDHMNFGDRIHDFFEIEDTSRICRINNPEECFIHLPFPDFDHYIERMNKYTTIEAQSIFEGKKEKRYLFKLLLLTLWRTFKEIILFKWYKDDFRGISIGFFAIYYCIISYIKLKLMEVYNSKFPEDKVNQEYKKIVDNILEEYEKY